MTIDDALRWAAVVRRDASFDGKFVYCVKSTTIFCRPICKARLARRMNVVFCDTPAEAQAMGYRPCKRCQPLLASYHPEADKVKIACNILKALPPDAPLPGLERLAQAAGLTKHHFHRLFKRETGQTPREYALACRGGKPGGHAVSADITPITPSTAVGDGSPGCAEQAANIDWDLLVNDHDLQTFDMIGYTLEDDLNKVLPIAPLDFPIVYYSIAETMYGKLLVAFKEDRVCKLELGTSDAELMASLEVTFSPTYYVHMPLSQADQLETLDYEQRIAAVINALEHPTGNIVDVPMALALSDCLG